MWIIYTTKEGDTMDTIIAKNKIKDPVTVLTHKNNKKFYKELKAGSPLPKGTKITIPDPKGKVYAVKVKGVLKHMDEPTYKDYLKGVNQKMDEAIFGLKQRITYATGRHDAQNKINEDQWFVAACVGLVNSVPEPKTRKKAESAFKAVEKAGKARNYKGVEKTIEPANIAIARYKHEVLSWIDGLINAGEGTVTVLEGVRTVGMVCGAVAATTVIAPAGLAAGILTGAGVGGGTQMAFDGFDSIGRVIVGTKPRSTGETLKRAAGAAIAGGLSAGLVGIIMKGAGPVLMKTATSNKFVEAQVKRIIAGSHGNLGPIYNAEVKAVVEKMGLKGADALVAARGNIMGVAMTKFLLRVSAGSIGKALGAGGYFTDHLNSWAAGDSKRLAGKSPDKTGQAFANEMTKSGAMDPVFDEMVVKNRSVFVKILRQELKAAAVAELKKQKK